MALKLQVHLVEARNLAAKDANGYSDPFVRLQLNKTKAKSATIYKNLDPVWNEEFQFKVDNVATDELLLTLWDEDFMGKSDFMGQVTIRVADVAAAEGQKLPPTWYKLQRKPDSPSRVSGDIQLALSFVGDSSAATRSVSLPDKGSIPSLAATEVSAESTSRSGSMPASIRTGASRLVSVVRRQLPSQPEDKEERTADSSSTPPALVPDSVEGGGAEGGVVPVSWFERNLDSVPSAGAFPAPFEGGVLINQAFGCSAAELNSVIFSPESDFFTDFTTVRKVTQLEIGPWGMDPKAGLPSRTVTYMTAASALMKSVKATEQVWYVRADSGGYIVEMTLSMPDLPYGNTFRTELQFCITPLPEKGCHLQLSYRNHFLQSTMMKGMLESGVRSGMKDAYGTYLQILMKHAAPSTGAGAAAGGAGSLAMPAAEEEKGFLDSLLALALPASAVVTLLSLILLRWHFTRLRRSGGQRGLPTWPLDLPDSYAELVTTAIITLAVQVVVVGVPQLLVTMGTWVQEGDAGKKASGEGWVVSAMLLEGENVGKHGTVELADPYAVLTCNGKTRTSSVKLQTNRPLWNELLEFDAFEDLPSTMDVELFDYEGPFAEAELLGRAEVNFVTKSKSQLADLWVPLEGKYAQMYGTRLHLRIVISESAGSSAIPDKMLDKISKEVGRKSHKISPEKNEAFQKLFDLPEHEFLVNDFSCALKKSILMQGRLFLSPRLVGFYSSLLGRKMKFKLMWEDVEELRESTASGANRRTLIPGITLYVKKGRSTPELAAASYGTDPEGRLKIRFQQFVRPSFAFKTIQVLWSHRALPPEQQLAKVEEAVAGEQLAGSASTAGAGQEEDSATFVGNDPPEEIDTVVSEVPVTTGQFLQVISSEALTKKLAESMGQLGLEATPWEKEGAGEQRSIKYTLSRQQSSFGTGVSAVQQSSRDPAQPPAWAQLEQMITLHDVPFGDQFQIELKWNIKNKTGSTSEMKTVVAVAWQKQTSEGTKLKIKTDIGAFYKKQSKMMLDLIVREIVSGV